MLPSRFHSRRLAGALMVGLVPLASASADDRLPESKAVGMDGRDYVRVELLAEADAQEASLIQALALQPWKG